MRRLPADVIQVCPANLTKEQINTVIDKVSNVMVSAFYDYPYTEFVFPKTSLKNLYQKNFERIFIDYVMYNGFVYVVPSIEQIEGVGLWLPSSKHITLLRLIRTASIKRTSIFMWSLLGRISETMMVADEMDKARELAIANKLLQSEHTYLFKLAVKKNSQGKGYGRKLIEKGISEFPAPFYLETFNAANVATYKKFGFEVTQEPKEIAQINDSEFLVIYPMAGSSDRVQNS